MAMADPDVLSNPVVALALRLVLGGYVIFMARSFYADPFGYFRKWMPRITEDPLTRSVIRGLAAFCVWGGCFIAATAIATQIFGLHGLPLAYALVTLAAIATWFLLPKESALRPDDESENDNMGRMK
jgi:hypothetical protein